MSSNSEDIAELCESARGYKLETENDLSTAYEEVQQYLSNQRLAAGHNLLKRIFKARQHVFKEPHERVQSFISPLLKSLCLVWMKFANDEGYTPIRTHSTFLNDLLEYCIAHHKYDQLEILLQECRCGIRETRATSPDSDFWAWDYEDTAAQSQLVRLRPRSDDYYWQAGENFYWEDSRMYCKTWQGVKMKRTFPDNPVQNPPTTIILHPDRVEYPDEKWAEALQQSDIIDVIRRKKRGNKMLGMLASCESGCQTKELFSFSNSQKIWIFPEDIIPKASKWRASRGKDVYQLHHLHGRGSQWVLMRYPWKLVSQLHDNFSLLLFSLRWGLDAQDDWRALMDTISHGPNDLREQTNLSLATHRRKPYKLFKDKYSIREKSETNIRVTVPFVPWEHFEESSAYKAGLTYQDYMLGVVDGLCASHIYFHNYTKLCRERPKNNRPKWTIPRYSRNTKMRPGFFGSTPSGKTLIMEKGLIEGFNLVSTRWTDWKHFRLEHIPASDTPSIKLPCGNYVRFIGMITGDFAYEETVKNRMPIKAYVVDVNFVDSSDQILNFVLSSTALQPNNISILSSHELRFFSGAVSPYLFRYAPERRTDIPEKMEPRQFDKINMEAHYDDEVVQWEEANRRQKWDRCYENRLRLCNLHPENTDALEALQADHDREQERRQEWDKKHEHARESSVQALQALTEEYAKEQERRATWDLNHKGLLESTVHGVLGSPINMGSDVSDATDASTANISLPSTQDRKPTLKKLLRKSGSKWAMKVK